MLPSTFPLIKCSPYKMFFSQDTWLISCLYLMLRFIILNLLRTFILTHNGTIKMFGAKEKSICIKMASKFSSLTVIESSQHKLPKTNRH